MNSWSERASTSWRDSPFWRRIARSRSPTFTPCMRPRCPRDSSPPGRRRLSQSSRHLSTFARQCARFHGPIGPESDESGARLRRNPAKAAAAATGAVTARNTWGPTARRWPVAELVRARSGSRPPSGPDHHQPLGPRRLAHRGGATRPGRRRRAPDARPARPATAPTGRSREPGTARLHRRLAHDPAEPDPGLLTAVLRPSARRTGAP